jgi:hypothetical protein
VSSKGDQEDDDLQWRPFSEGGFLDVDRDELIGFMDNDDWELLDDDDFEDGDDFVFSDDEIWTSS